MGRKSITDTTLVVDIDGELVVWTEGLVSGPKALIAAGKFATKIELPVSISVHGPVVVANLDDPKNPVGAFAAIMAMKHGRGRILQAPQELMDVLPFEDADELDESWLADENSQDAETENRVVKIYVQR
jgi:hypothetical protein